MIKSVISINTHVLKIEIRNKGKLVLISFKIWNLVSRYVAPAGVLVVFVSNL